MHSCFAKSIIFWPWLFLNNRRLFYVMLFFCYKNSEKQVQFYILCSTKYFAREHSDIDTDCRYSLFFDCWLVVLTAEVLLSSAMAMIKYFDRFIRICFRLSSHRAWIWGRSYGHNRSIFTNITACLTLHFGRFIGPAKLPMLSWSFCTKSYDYDYLGSDEKAISNCTSHSCYFIRYVWANYNAKAVNKHLIELAKLCSSKNNIEVFWIHIKTYQSF